MVEGGKPKGGGGIVEAQLGRDPRQAVKRGLHAYAHLRSEAGLVGVRASRGCDEIHGRISQLGAPSCQSLSEPTEGSGSPGLRVRATPPTLALTDF
jgi:hypothetical protein